MSQEGHLSAFYGKKVIPRMSHASTYVSELFAITQSVQKWHLYLLGVRFLIRTDHRSLKELMSQVIQTPEQQLYLSKFL